MAKKLKVRIPDKKEDLLVETTQSGLAWMRRYQGPLLIGAAVIVAIIVLAVYGTELEKRSDTTAWKDYLAVGPEGTADAFAAIAEQYAGTTVEPWALLDQAHALARTTARSDWEKAADIYRDVAERFGESSPVVDRVALEGLKSMSRELAFQLPPPLPEEEESPEESGEVESDGGEAGDGAADEAPADEAPAEETPAEDPPAEDPAETPPAEGEKP